jgi:hypothetical protein
MSLENSVLALAFVRLNHGEHEEPRRPHEVRGAEAAWGNRSPPGSAAMIFPRSALSVSSHGSVHLRGSSRAPWLSLPFVGHTRNAGSVSARPWCEVEPLWVNSVADKPGHDGRECYGRLAYFRAWPMFPVRAEIPQTVASSRTPAALSPAGSSAPHGRSRRHAHGFRAAPRR